MADDTYSSLTLPLLERADSEFDLRQVAEDLGVRKDEIQTEIDRLVDALFIGGELVRKGGWQSGGGYVVWRYQRPMLLEKGMRAVGRWPGNPYDTLLAVLDARIDDAPDAETKSKLKATRAAIVDLGTSVVGSVLAAYVRHLAGLP